MKRKLFISFMVLMLICSLGIIGCEKSHEHTFAKDWSTSETQHWHACTVEGCEEKHDAADHSPSTKWESDEAEHWHKCTVCERDLAKTPHDFSNGDCECGKKKPGETSPEHILAKDWSTNETQHWHACTVEGCEEKHDAADHSPSTKWESDEAEHWHKCTVCERDLTKTPHDFSDGDCECGKKKPAVFTSEMLDSLKGDALALTGEVYYKETRIQDDGEEISNEIWSDLVTEITSGTFKQIETVRDAEDFVYERMLFKGDDGNPYMYIYDVLKNEYKAVRFGADENQDGTVDKFYSWDMFVNPFNALTIDKFSAGDKDNEFILDASVASDVSNVLTGWNDTIVSFVVVVEDGKVVSMRMNTAVEDHTSVNYGDYTSYSSYELSIVARGDDVEAPTVPKPYPSTEEHKKLLKALEELTEGSYTITHTDTDSFESTEDIIETIYYTPEAVYVNYEEEPYGYLQADGKVIHFYDEGGTLTEFAVYKDETIADDYFPHIDFDPAVLESLGDGVFEAYNEDIAEMLAQRLDLIEFSAIAATSLRIELDGEHISKVIYDYPAGTVEMVYSNFGSTTTGLDFSGLLGTEVDIPDGIPDEAFGTFKTEEGADDEYTIILTSSSCSINGVNVAFTLTVDDYGAFILTFTYNEKEYECSFTESNPYDDAYWFIMDKDCTVFVQAYKVSD